MNQQAAAKHTSGPWVVANGRTSTVERIKTAACLLLLLLACGFVGRMDYEDVVRSAAFACEQRYGRHAAFVETDDGWECQPDNAIRNL